MWTWKVRCQFFQNARMGVAVRWCGVAIDGNRRCCRRCHMIVIVIEWNRLYGIEIGWLCGPCRWHRRRHNGHDGCLTGWWHCWHEYFRCVDIWAPATAGNNRVTTWVSAMIHLTGTRMVRNGRWWWWWNEGMVSSSAKINSLANGSQTRNYNSQNVD